MNRLKTILLFGVVLGLITGCSDSGDSPTGSGGGGANPSLSIADASGGEGSTLLFTVTASSAASQAVAFSVSITPLSATAGDYTLTSSNGAIGAGASSTTVSIDLTDDAVSEASELFQVNISSPTNATIADGTAIGTVLPSDGGSDISFSATVQPVFTTNCGTGFCHGTGSGQGGFVMGDFSASTYRGASGSNGAVLQIGNAGASNLYLKTTSTPPFGSRMPLGGQLSVADQQKIRDWINQGAQSN